MGTPMGTAMGPGCAPSPAAGAWAHGQKHGITCGRAWADTHNGIEGVLHDLQGRASRGAWAHGQKRGITCGRAWACPPKALSVCSVTCSRGIPNPSLRSMKSKREHTALSWALPWALPKAQGVLRHQQRGAWAHAQKHSATCRSTWAGRGACTPQRPVAHGPQGRASTGARSRAPMHEAAAWGFRMTKSPMRSSPPKAPASASLLRHCLHCK